MASKYIHLGKLEIGIHRPGKKIGSTISPLHVGVSDQQTNKTGKFAQNDTCSVKQGAFALVLQHHFDSNLVNFPFSKFQMN